VLGHGRPRHLRDKTRAAAISFRDHSSVRSLTDQ
jgi:hypothetical protein